MAGFSYTREEREFILNITKIQKENIQRSIESAEKSDDPLNTVTIHALQYQMGLADSIIGKIEGVA